MKCSFTFFLFIALLNLKTVSAQVNVQDSLSLVDLYTRC